MIRFHSMVAATSASTRPRSRARTASASAAAPASADSTASKRNPTAREPTTGAARPATKRRPAAWRSEDLGAFVVEGDLDLGQPGLAQLAAQAHLLLGIEQQEAASAGAD